MKRRLDAIRKRSNVHSKVDGDIYSSVDGIFTKKTLSIQLFEDFLEFLEEFFWKRAAAHTD